MSKILLIPDIHGRDFWKKAKDFEGEIVFLGDYLDPYRFEFDKKENRDGLKKNVFLLKN